MKRCGSKTLSLTKTFCGTVAALFMVVSTMSVMAAGGREQVAHPDAIRIPVLFRDGGGDAATVMWREVIDRFHEEYAGVYQLDIEWVPGMAEEIRHKLRTLNTARNLPAFVTQLGPEPAFAEALIRDGRLMDLKPYFDADPEWQRYVFEESVEFNTTEDGRMYTTPSTGSPYVGIFYNMEHFATAGIDEFPSTWEEFWDAADRLQAAGITPLSLHTTETGWCTNLMMTSYLAQSQQGRDFMAIRYPSDEFVSDVFINAVQMVRRMYDYTPEDAIGGTYALAANHFTTGNTAMIPNGPWMIESFSDPDYSPVGFDQIVGYARYPGDVMISNLGREYGYGVSMDHDLEVREAAVDWIKFLATRDIIGLQAIGVGHFNHKIELTEEELSKLGPVHVRYANSVEGVRHTIPWFQGQWDPISQHETVVGMLPEFLYGQITAEQYAEAMRRSAREFLASN